MSLKLPTIGRKLQAADFAYSVFEDDANSSVWITIKYTPNQNLITQREFFLIELSPPNNNVDFYYVFSIAEDAMSAASSLKNVVFGYDEGRNYLYITVEGKYRRIQFAGQCYKCKPI